MVVCVFAFAFAGAAMTTTTTATAGLQFKRETHFAAGIACASRMMCTTNAPHAMCVFEFVYAAASWKIAATENDTNKSGSKSKDKTAQAE